MRIGFVLFAVCAVTLGICAAAPAQGAKLSYYNYCGQYGVANVVAPWYCSQINQSLSAYWKRWEPLALVAMMFSFMIAIILFSSGVAFKIERLRTFGIGELYEATATAIIVIAFLFISATLFGVIPGFVIGNINPYQNSLNYISQTISTGENSIYTLFQIVLSVRAYESATISISPFGENFPKIYNFFAYALMYFVYLPGWGILDLQIDSMLILYGEFYLILLMMYMAIPVFLIPGIIFRSILPTRPLGGMMISVAIGFYLIMPLLFTAAYLLTSPQMLSQLNEETAALNKYGGGTLNAQSIASPTSPLVETLGSIQSNMGSYWLSILFYPALILAMTYAFITQLAQLLGGFARMSGRMRL